MANINFTDFESKRDRSSFGDRPRVGYFNSLKDDGDETLIRLNYEAKKDFEVVTVHRVVLDGRWRNVECLKNPYETDDKCPLCASGDRMKTKIFVQLLQYSRDEQGNITYEPKVWERGYGFVPELMDTIADAVEDGKVPAGTPISDLVIKVKRVGAKGSLDTKYKLKVMQPAVVPEDVFKKDFSAFEGFDSSHHDYMKKTAEEMGYFLEHQEFPERAKPASKPAEAPAAPKPAEVKETFNQTGDAFPEFGRTPARAMNEKPEAAAAEPEKKNINRYNW